MYACRVGTARDYWLHGLTYSDLHDKCLAFLRSDIWLCLSEAIAMTELCFEVFREYILKFPPCLGLASSLIVNQLHTHRGWPPIHDHTGIVLTHIHTIRLACRPMLGVSCFKLQQFHV